MGHYCDKEVDALHEQARATSDPAKRKAIYEKLTEKFLASGWIFYLYHPQYLIAHTERLEGFVPIQDGILRVVGVRLK
jgi:peptide/nickel transport system substrate-binding protein